MFFKKFLLLVPTQFSSLHILKNLNVKDDQVDSQQRKSLSEMIETFKRHVIGTQSTDLSQIYNGQVIIQGSVKLRDAKMFSPKSRVIVGGKEIQQNISANYWMKSTAQKLRGESFTLKRMEARKGIVITSFLNKNSIKDFLIHNSKVAQGSVSLRFENAVAKKDVRGHKENFPSLLFFLNQTTVPRQGAAVMILSSVDFRGNLSVRDLRTNFINDLPVNALTNSRQKLFVLNASKSVKKLQLKHLNVEIDLDMRSYNNINQPLTLDDGFIRIDRPVNLDSLKIKTFDAANLLTEFFEDHQFNEFVENLDNEFRPSKASRNVSVAGNVHFNSNLLVTAFNRKLLFNEFVSMLALKNDAIAGVGGRKVFQQNVITNSLLSTKLFNGFSMDRLLYKSLMRGEQQTIEKEAFVRKVQAKSMRAKALNNIRRSQFVDKTKLNLPLKVNFNLEELTVNNMVSKSSSFDISKMIELMEFPRRKNWSYVTVDLQVDMPLQKVSFLDRLYLFSVLKSGAPQGIIADVQVVTKKLYIKQLSKYDGIIVAKSNVIPILQFLLDSVKNRSDVSQIINGRKSFLAPIYVRNLYIEGRAYYKSDDINNVNIVNLNRTIVRPASTINVEKVFSRPIHADAIELRHRINNLQVESLIFVQNKEIQLPKLKMRKLEVADLSTYTFNDYSFLHFIENRMKKSYGSLQEVKGMLKFAELDLKNETIATSINNVVIDDAIFEQSNQLQDMVGRKSVAGKIRLVGPSLIKNLNGYDFKDFIQNSVMSMQNHLVKDMELAAIDARKGLVAQHSINGHQIEELLTSVAHFPKLTDLVSLMTHLQHQMKELTDNTRMKAGKSKRLLYIDYDPDIQITYEGQRYIGNRCTNNVVMPSKYNSIVVREKRDMEMVIEMSSLRIKVKPNLQCQKNSIKSKTLLVEWSYKNGPNNDTYLRDFKFENEITDVKFVESKNGVILMILMMQNQSAYTSEISVLVLHKEENDWYENQEKFVNLNFISRSALVETSQHIILVVSSFNDETPLKSDYVMTFFLDPATDKFVQKQQIPGGKFDIILGINIAPIDGSKLFLLLARERSKELLIYRFKEDTHFIFQRKIPFDNEIVEVVVLYIKNDLPLFIVSLNTGDFCVFEWRGIESWKSKLCGHFESIHQIKSYEYLKRQHLFLTSTMNTGTALTIYRQGEFF